MSEKTTVRVLVEVEDPSDGHIERHEIKMRMRDDDTIALAASIALGGYCVGESISYGDLLLSMAGLEEDRKSFDFLIGLYYARKMWKGYESFEDAITISVDVGKLMGGESKAKEDWFYARQCAERGITMVNAPDGLLDQP